MRPIMITLVLATLLLAPSVNAQDFPEFFAALTLEDEGSPEAFEKYREIMFGEQPLYDHASYKIIKSEYESGDLEQLIVHGKRYLEIYPYSRYSPVVSLMLAEGLCNFGRFSEASLVLDEFRKKFPNELNARMLTISGIALAGLGEYEKAQRTLGKAIHLYSFESWSIKAKEKAIEIKAQGHAPFAPPSKDEIIEAINRAWNKRYFITCQRLCNAYVRLYPGGDSWRYRLKAVDCLHARRKRSESRKLLQRIDPLIPKKSEAQAALLVRWSLAERGRGFKGQPRTSLWEVTAKYPKTEAALLAKYYIGFSKYDAYNFSDALGYLEPFIEQWKHDIHKDDALWYAGFSNYLEGDFTKAVNHFSDFATGFPDHKDLDRVIYWRGRSLAKLGDKKGAGRDYQWLVNNLFGTYYGLAAQMMLETMGHTHFAAKEHLYENLVWDQLIPGMTIPIIKREWAQTTGGGDIFDSGARSALEHFSVYGHPAIRRLTANFLAFYRAGRISLAYDEARYMYEFRDDDPFCQYLTGIMFSLCSDNLYATYASNKQAAKIRDGELFDPHRINARRQFPLMFFDLIQEVSIKYQLDPYLTIALVKQESAFQVKANSWVGAKGLFQVMPGTGKWIARKRGIKDFRVKDLYTPETSADFGAWYFRRLLDNNDNDVIKALAGYNAGGSRATRWWRENPNRNYDEMIELIGFKETKKYVKTILRNWEMYKRLYEDSYSGSDGKMRETVFIRLLDHVPEPPPEN